MMGILVLLVAAASGILALLTDPWAICGQGGRGAGPDRAETAAWAPRTDAPPRPASERAQALKGARYSLWKNSANLTDNQQVKLAWIAATDPRLYRAYLIKEGLRVVFAMTHEAAVEALDRWIGWARRVGSRNS